MLPSPLCPGADAVLIRKLQKVGEAFRLRGSLAFFEELGGGNVNRTFRVGFSRDGEPEEICSFLIQKVNTYAFREPEKLMANVGLVTEHIRSRFPDRLCLRFYRTPDGKPYLRDEDGFWRVCNYIPSVTFEACRDAGIVRSAGEAFGDFINSLRDLPPDKLFYTIPDFHDTGKRFEALLRAVKEDRAGRAASVRPELESLLSVRERACLLTDLQREGRLPLRVTHNDTKIGNVLFDEKTRRALAVIDLDTVMPGLVGHDFGDAVRSAANRAKEDCKDPDKAGLDPDVFRAFSEGFLEKTASALTETEIDTLALSCFALTAELAARFLTDYLNGDPYFRISYPDHNLVRARCQLALARDMLAEKDEMDAIVRGCVKKYR